jgi:hypothetical protein
MVSYFCKKREAKRAGNVNLLYPKKGVLAIENHVEMAKQHLRGVPNML